MKKLLFLIFTLICLNTYSQECNCGFSFLPIFNYSVTVDISNGIINNEIKGGIWGRGNNHISLLIGVKQFRIEESKIINNDKGNSINQISYYTNFKPFGEIGLKIFKIHDFAVRTYIQLTPVGLYNGLEFDYIFQNAINVGVHYLTDFNNSRQIGLNFTFALK